MSNRIKFYTKSDEDLESEFTLNKELNKLLPAEDRHPENITEYVEKLLIENIRSIKFLEIENIPSHIKSERLHYLENIQHMLLDWLDRLEMY